MRRAALAITAAGLVACPAATKQASRPDGPLVYFPFDEGAGATVKDRSSRGLAGTLHGPMWTDGRYGGALTFDGTDDFVGVDPIGVNPDELTIEFWIRPGADIKAGGPRQDLIYRRDGDGRPHVTFNRAKDGKLGFYVTLKSGSEKGIRTQRSSWSAGTWYHVAAVSKPGEFRIYVDGRLENRRRVGTVPIDVQFDRHGISIGARAGSQSFFSGSVDEVRLWDRALTEDEVRKAFSSSPQAAPGNP